MGKRPAEGESFDGNMGSIQREDWPSMQREELPPMETGLERIAALSRHCEVPSDERSAGKLHATFCGSRGRVTAPGDPVLGVKFPGPTRRLHADPRRAEGRIVQ
jgi:hypothetical protein